VTSVVGRRLTTPCGAAAGQVAVATNNGFAARLAKGSAGHKLSVKGDGSTLAYQAPVAIRTRMGQRRCLRIAAHLVAHREHDGLLSTGRVLLMPIWYEAGTVVNSITFLSGTTALSAGTNQWFALADSSYLTLAKSADDTSTAWGSNTLKTLNMSSPASYTIPNPGRVLPRMHGDRHDRPDPEGPFGSRPDHGARRDRADRPDDAARGRHEPRAVAVGGEQLRVFSEPVMSNPAPAPSVDEAAEITTDPPPMPYDGLPLNAPTKVSEDTQIEVWATRTANGGFVEHRAKAGSPQANTTDLLTKLAQLRSDAATATAALQTIRNRTSPTAAQVAADVKTEAQIMQQVIQRLLAIVLYATGDLTDNTGT
jgi:hypothetical protein